MKNVLIIGDSYSTFKGYIPKNYVHYYGVRGEDGRDFAEYMKVEETWWHRVITITGSNLVLNNSWSGSPIGYTGYSGSDCSKNTSFIFRLRQLLENGFFEENAIDTLFVFGGTNDSWADAPLGEITYDNWKEEDLYSVCPAIMYFANLIKTNLKGVTVYFIINTDLKEEVSTCIKTACEVNGFNKIVLSGIEKESGHPNVNGMKQISEQVLSALVD